MSYINNLTKKGYEMKQEEIVKEYEHTIKQVEDSVESSARIYFKLEKLKRRLQKTLYKIKGEK
jgi:hypothetical protein